MPRNVAQKRGKAGEREFPRVQRIRGIFDAAERGPEAREGRGKGIPTSATHPRDFDAAESGRGTGKGNSHECSTQEAVRSI
jgi:hypothetical protein